MDLQIFKSNSWEIRTIEKDGETWFVGKDICTCLGLSNSREAISKLDEDEKGVISNDTLGGKQKLRIINESGLYSLIIKSRKKEAKRFKKWVTSEVLPSIRKTGSYSINHEIPQSFSDALLLASDQARKIEQLEEQKKLDSPKISFAETVENAQSTISIGSFAKLSGQIGRNKLFSRLRNNKILMNNNQPYQKYIDSGYFETSESVIKRTHGDQIIITTYITGKGQIWVSKKIEGWIKKA